MNASLMFNDVKITPFDIGDGKIWVSSQALAEMLGYKDKRSISKIFNRNKDEFTEGMTRVVTVTTSGKINGLQHVKTRIFSARGAHLVGMLANTKIAKMLRQWLLNIIDHESENAISMLDNQSLTENTVMEMSNRIAKVDRWSKDNFGIPGSQQMSTRKKHLKVIREAEQKLREFSQFKLPGFDDLEGFE